MQIGSALLTLCGEVEGCVTVRIEGVRSSSLFRHHFPQAANVSHLCRGPYASIGSQSPVINRFVAEGSVTRRGGDKRKGRSMLRCLEARGWICRRSLRLESKLFLKVKKTKHLYGTYDYTVSCKMCMKVFHHVASFNLFSHGGNDRGTRS